MKPPFAPIPGAPAAEHERSPAARAVARLAAQSELFFSHFEHRFQVPVPQAWRAGEADDATPVWVSGVLPEPKYQAFRHDLLVASFHPGHRAKWTAHELCHGLVGFAWRPGASSFFHALAAWLAELLPVALWYFFDEAGLRRCGRHAGGGPLFQIHCEGCEQAALEGMRAITAADRRFVGEGKAFVDRELAAIARSRRLGRPQGTRFATVDLASDGVAYAAAHGPRLKAPDMERFVAQFFGPGQGHHASLEALEARVLEVCEAIVTPGAKTQPWSATRWDWAAQDVGYRLIAARAGADGQAARELDAIIDRLAAARTRPGLATAIAAYAGLTADRRRGTKKGALLAPSDLFAVGYELPGGHGRSVHQLAEGLASACPSAWAALGREVAQIAEAFARRDVPLREPIGRRFARFLGRRERGPRSELARVEAAITHVAPRDAIAFGLDPGEAEGAGVKLAAGAEIVPIHHDVLGVEPARVQRAPRLAQPKFLAFVRTGAADVDIVELPEATVRALRRAKGGAVSRARLALAPGEIEELLRVGVLVPERYRA